MSIMISTPLVIGPASIGTSELVDGAVTAAKIDSGAAADGQVLTADGNGGAAWQAAAGSFLLRTTEKWTSQSVIASDIATLLPALIPDGGYKIVVTAACLDTFWTGKFEFQSINGILDVSLISLAPNDPPSVCSMLLTVVDMLEV